MVKKVSKREVDEMNRLGKVEFAKKPREIAQFNELIEKLNEMISSNSDRTQADLLRSQAQLEVIGTLQKMIRSKGTKSQVSPVTIDMEPLSEILREMREENSRRQLVSYQFEIQRDPGGGMAGVTATPIQATQH